MSDNGFDPSRHLVPFKGRDYLEVKWRLVWLRDRHPDAIIATELVHHESGVEAICKATVSIPDGGSATGWGTETLGDFRDFVEKAETKALGRALAALGFGTQFCDDHEFGAADGRVVDAPVSRPPRPTPVSRPTPNVAPGASRGATAASPPPLTDAEKREAEYLDRIEAAMTPNALIAVRHEIDAAGLKDSNRLYHAYAARATVLDPPKE